MNIQPNELIERRAGTKLEREPAIGHKSNSLLRKDDFQGKSFELIDVPKTITVSE